MVPLYAGLIPLFFVLATFSVALGYIAFAFYSSLRKTAGFRHSYRGRLIATFCWSVAFTVVFGITVIVLVAILISSTQLPF